MPSSSLIATIHPDADRQQRKHYNRSHNASYDTGVRAPPARGGFHGGFRGPPLRGGEGYGAAVGAGADHGCNEGDVSTWRKSCSFGRTRKRG
jgi:hypothetical protein